MHPNRRISWLAVVLFFAVLTLLFALGFWQLVRGFEKADIDARSNLAAGNFSTIDSAADNWAALSYTFADLKGVWREDRSFLLQNRLWKGRPGVEVLVPFLLTDGTWLLVNRGWVAMNPGDSRELPEIPPLISSMAPRGQLYQPAKGFTLGETIQGAIEWPVGILYYDFAALSNALGHSLAPVVLVLNPQHPDSFVTIWRPASITPERHYAYVAQWWGLALTLIIFGFIWRRKTHKQ